MGPDRETLRRRFEAVRARTVELARAIPVEAQLAQAFADASPTKWHLGHTTWFFDRFVLARFDATHTGVDPHFDYVFNSYYDGVGERQPRAERSLVVRPTLPEVHEYRARIDEAMRAFLPRVDDAAAFAIELGTHHEEQHQELILTDVKPLLSLPLSPELFGERKGRSETVGSSFDWISHPGGLVEIGSEGEGFAFDNERPRHRVWLEPFALATRGVTVGEYRAFIEDGGYARAALWLSDGWTAVRTHGWKAPMYWERDEPVATAPLAHVSFYEADAYARWAGARLPREEEWETIGEKLRLGEVWEWTASPYVPYPRFQPFAGVFGEYNGKFMCNQFVLRGGSRFSPTGHVRSTYRNFFPPDARWQLTGLRLARWG